MATDPWYVRELTADVPAEEWDAAVEQEDWEMDEGEDGDSVNDAESDDPDYSEVLADDNNGGDVEDEGSVSSVESSCDGEDTASDVSDGLYDSAESDSDDASATDTASSTDSRETAEETSATGEGQ